MAGLTALTIAAARDGLVQGDFTAEELTLAHIEAMQAARSLNAFVPVTPDRSTAAAKSSVLPTPGTTRPERSGTAWWISTRALLPAVPTLEAANGNCPLNRAARLVTIAP